jgi:hypothetical protein
VKRVIALVLAILMLLTGCKLQTVQIQTHSTAKDFESESSPSPISETEAETFLEALDPSVFTENTQLEFTTLSDPSLLQYVEDNIYSDLVARFDSEDYIIENVSAIYVSEEYLEEVAYNSKPNIYFGYTLEELDAQFQGTRYIFSLGKNGETVVEEFAAYDDIYDRVIKNVLVGSGVILVCLTVSVVSGGVGAPAAVSMIFASAAKTGTAYALSSGTISAVAAGAIKGIQSGDFEEAMKAAAVAGSESFKWGAITGVIVGGAGEALKIYRSAKPIPSYRESELTVLQRTPNGSEQVSYLHGREVKMNTPGATRPDVIAKNADGTIRAIEVKNYDLSLDNNISNLAHEVRRQVSNRQIHLPRGATQEIVLDVRGRGFSKEVIDKAVTAIRKRLADIYPDIKISILRY